MKITRKNSGFNLGFSVKENQAILKVFNFIIENLDWELPVRTGFSIEEYRQLEQLISNTQMNTHIFSKDELRMIHQSLNEILNGIKVDAFENEFGLSEIHLGEIFVALRAAISQSNLRGF